MSSWGEVTIVLNSTRRRCGVDTLGDNQSSLRGRRRMPAAPLPPVNAGWPLGLRASLPLAEVSIPQAASTFASAFESARQSGPSNTAAVGESIIGQRTKPSELLNLTSS